MIGSQLQITDCVHSHMRWTREATNQEKLACGLHPADTVIWMQCHDCNERHLEKYIGDGKYARHSYCDPKTGVKPLTQAGGKAPMGGVLPDACPACGRQTLEIQHGVIDDQSLLCTNEACGTRVRIQYGVIGISWRTPGL